MKILRRCVEDGRYGKVFLYCTVIILALFSNNNTFSRIQFLQSRLTKVCHCLYIFPPPKASLLGCLQVRARVDTRVRAHAYRAVRNSATPKKYFESGNQLHFNGILSWRYLHQGLRTVVLGITADGPFSTFEGTIIKPFSALISLLSVSIAQAAQASSCVVLSLSKKH